MLRRFALGGTIAALFIGSLVAPSSSASGPEAPAQTVPRLTEWAPAPGQARLTARSRILVDLASGANRRMARADLDELTTYDEALGPAQVSALYDSYSPR